MSSTRMFGPVASGPKAQMERAASKSQSYLVWKNSPSFFLIERKGRSFRKQESDLHSRCIYNRAPFRHETASARDAHGLAGRKTKPGSLPRGCCLVLCTLQVPAFPSSPVIYSQLDSCSPRSLIPVPRYLHHLVLNVLCQSLLQGLSNHRDLVPEERQPPSAIRDGNGSNWEDLGDWQPCTARKILRGWDVSREGKGAGEGDGAPGK